MQPLLVYQEVLHLKTVWSIISRFQIERYVQKWQLPTFSNWVQVTNLIRGGILKQAAY